MLIRKASLEELDSVMEVYAGARQFMKDHGNPNQWGTIRPSRQEIEKDIKDGNSYICEELGRIAAVFYYKKGEDPTYAQIYEGQWIDNTPYGVVHRIASSGICKGAGSFCMQWAFKQCGNVRIDTHRQNIVMQNMLKKNGFSYCGIIYIEDGNERLAFQKKLTSKNMEKENGCF